MPAAKWGAVTVDAAVPSGAGSPLNALANSAYALGSAIDNTPATLGAFYGDLEVVLSSSVSAGTGTPYIGVYLLPSLDGTNYPTPPGGSAGATPASYFVGSILANASTGFTVGHLRGIVLPPFNFKILIQNVLGVALPATNTSTVKLYRYSEQAS
jgi:hypothetical protein